MKRILNASSYTDYHLCPTLYEFKHIKNMDKVFYFENDESKQGSLLHGFIDSDLKGRKVPLDYIVKEEKFNTCWNNYLTFKEEHFSEKEVLSEFPFIIGNLSEESLLNGRVDCMYTENDTLFIIDWKTSPSKSRFNYLNYKLQMEFYSFCLSKVKDISNVKTSVINLTDATSYHFNFDKEKLEQLENKVLSFINETTEKRKVYIPKPVSLSENVKLCEKCNFQVFCNFR